LGEHLTGGNQFNSAALNLVNSAAKFFIPCGIYLADVRVKAGQQLFGKASTLLW